MRGQACRHEHWFALSVWMLGLAVTATACRTPTAGTASTKDIATNSASDGTAGGVYLYVRDGQMISRTKCPDGLLEVNYNPAHCTEGKRSVPATPFIDAISVGVGDTVGAHAKNVQDLYAGIATIQNRQLQVLAAAPVLQSQLQALTHQLTAAETTIAEMQVQIDGFDQQMSAIKARLATHSDVDLAVQLGTLLDERGKVLVQLDQARTDEQAKRAQFIAANSSTLGDNADMEGQKAIDQQQLDSEAALLASAMQEVSDLNKTIAYLGDPTFTAGVLEGRPLFQSLRPFTRRFQAAFDGLVAAPSPQPSLPPPSPPPPPAPIATAYQCSCVVTDPNSIIGFSKDVTGIQVTAGSRSEAEQQVADELCLRVELQDNPFFPESSDISQVRCTQSR